MTWDQEASGPAGLPTAGSRLRQRREERQITLEAAAEATKLTTKLLSALEEDRLEDMPGIAYWYGFVRTYARYLGLPADELLELAPHQPGEPLPGTAEEAAAATRRSSFRWHLLGLPLLLLVGLLISTLFVPAPPPAVQRVSPLPPAAPETAAVQAPHSSAQAAAPVAAPAAAPGVEPQPEAVPSAAQTAGLLLRMRVRQNGNLTITIDDSATQTYELTAGDLIEWKANRAVALELSDGGSVEMELNGSPLKWQGTSGRPAYLQLDANGLKR